MYTGNVGRHMPVCGGRCLVARTTEGGGDMSSISFWMIAAPTGLWCGFAAPTLWSDVSPVLVILGLVTCAASIVFLFAARFTEPGLLPTVDVDGTKTAAGHQKKLIILDGQRLEYADKRAKWVRETGNVVEKFDHFCPWVGNVVGKRNYRSFYFFISFTNLHAVYILTTSVVVVSERLDEYGSVDEFAAEKPHIVLVLAGLCGYVAIILCCVGGLWSFHNGTLSTPPGSEHTLDRLTTAG